MRENPMLFLFWSAVFDVGPTLKQHWISAGIDFRRQNLTSLKIKTTPVTMTSSGGEYESLGMERLVCDPMSSDVKSAAICSSCLHDNKYPLLSIRRRCGAFFLDGLSTKLN